MFSIRHLKHCTVAMAALSISSYFEHAAEAMPALSTLQPVKQPDGSEIQLRARGGEDSIRWSTAEGHPVAQGEDGYWYFVQPSSAQSNAPELSDIRVSKNKSPGFETTTSEAGGEPGPSRPFDLGRLRTEAEDPNVVLILVEFEDVSGRYRDVESWSNRIEKTGGLSNGTKQTIKDYYQKATFGKVNFKAASETHDVADDGVIGWLQLPGDHPVNFPLDGGSGMTQQSVQIARAAIAAADDYIDFGAYDQPANPSQPCQGPDNVPDGAISGNELSVIIVVAGYAQETTLRPGGVNPGVPGVWSHVLRTSVIFTSDANCIGNEVAIVEYAEIGEVQGWADPEYPFSDSFERQATLGVFVHELGHLTFGLPDLYNPNDTLNGLDGIGPFGVMSGGAWGMNVDADTHPGETPVLPSAWTLHRMNWADTAYFGAILPTGHTGLHGGEPRVVKVRASIGRPSPICSEQEYFLVQYRKNMGYDAGLSFFLGSDFDEGANIFHINEGVDNNRSDFRPLVDLEEANNIKVGLFDPTILNEHLWRPGVRDLFNSRSRPNSNYYSFFSPADSGVSVKVEEVIDRQFSFGPFRFPYSVLDLTVGSACHALRLTANLRGNWVRGAQMNLRCGGRTIALTGPTAYRGSWPPGRSLPCNLPAETTVSCSHRRSRDSVRILQNGKPLPATCSGTTCTAVAEATDGPDFACDFDADN